MENKGYRKNCFETNILEGDDILAKKIYNENTQTHSYYIKYGYAGSYSGFYRNPYDKSYDKTEYKWKKVNGECFNLYLKFLKTNNVLYLRQAERII